MKRFLFLFIWFIIALAAPLLHAAEAARPSGQVAILPEILILNSYHLGYAWSDDEQAGVIDLFRAKDENWLPVIEYLDLKRLLDGRHLAELKKLFRLKYQNKKFSMVIAMDNPALEFAVDNQAELFGNAPIVFCGINNYTPSMLKGRTDVTGIVEAIDIAGTIEVMLRLHPATREIFVPHDYTATGLEAPKAIEALIPRFGAKVRFRFTDPMTMEEVLKELERLPGDSLVLPISFITDKSGRTFGMTEATRLFSEHSPVPVYSTFEQRLGFGIVGGKLLSARIHGTNAARIALRVLAGEKASAIPVVFESDSRFMFDYKVMSRFGIPLSALPENSTVINKPVSFYAAHRTVILTSLGAIAFLIIIIFLLTINIIQKRRSLEAIRRSEELFRVIASSTPDLLLVHDSDLRYSFVMNPQLGLTEKDMIGKTDHDFLSKEDADKLTEIKRQVLKTGQPAQMEVPLISSDGGQEYFNGSYIPKFDAKGLIDGLIGYFRNVTEHRSAEERERFARNVLDILNQPKRSTDTITDILELIKKSMDIEAVGIRLKEGDDFPYYETMGFSEDFVRVERRLCTYDEEGKIVRDEQGNAVPECMCGNIIRGRTDPTMPFFTKAGSFWTNCTTDLLASTTEKDRQTRTRNRCNGEGYESVALVPLRTGDEIIGLLQLNDRRRNRYTLNIINFFERLGLSIGIALARKRSEDALRESEGKYRTIIEDIEDGYHEVDMKGNFTFINEPVCKMLGYRREELLGMNNRQYADEENARKVYQAYNRVYLTGQPVKNFEWQIIKKDGARMDVEVSISLIRDGEGHPTGFRGIVRDTTEHRQIEEEKRKLKERLQHADKMEAIGTLAGGIAHDFNNLLMEVQGCASMMLLDLDKSHPHYERLKLIEEQVQSGAELTRQLLGFARGGRYEVKPTDMNDIIKKTSSMFGRTKKEITIHRKYGKYLWTVEVDRGQMEQVFVNLYVNAWQAMPGGGDIYLETEGVFLDDTQAIYHAMSTGKYVKISVTDNGIGMDEKTRERIFEPFFTTKKMGRGTGLGLAMVYGIIKGHKGMIHVDSEPGHGTTFNIYLPASEKEVIEEKRTTETIARGTETILFVDDEKMILEVSRELLESRGYRVYAVGSGQEAIAVYLEKRNEIDLVILDMIMPGISGGETFDRLREINPGIKVLLSSGYSIEGQAQEILDRGCNGFIQKPFQLGKLSGKVREILD